MNDRTWYDAGEREADWYMPAAISAPAAETQKKKRRPWLIALVILLGLVALITLSSLLFSARSSHSEESAEEQGIIEDILPDAGDYKDFFDNFYTNSYEHAEDCLIERVSSYPSLEVELRPAGTTELSLQAIYEKCVSSVVAVTAYPSETNDDNYYWGSGVILSEDGYIITNAHVIEGTCRAAITLWNDEVYPALLVGTDSRSDIAVLKIEAAGLTPAEFCDMESLVVGDGAVAIGNPLGSQFRSTMTNGIISGIDRGISYNGTTLTLLQTSAPINEGNSGGPLFNMYGQVIGITNMKMSNNYSGGATIEGVGFAIPSKTVKAMADSILAEGEVIGRPALGVLIGPVPDSAREQYSLPGGLYVSDVYDGSDCKAQGLQKGDIIVAVNGQEVSEVAQVSAILADAKVGDVLTLTVWRPTDGGGEATFSLDVRLVDVNDVF